MMITANGLNIHFEVRGTGKPVVCLHGFSENLGTWDEIDLSGFRLILVDLTGHGSTEKPSALQPYGLPTLLETLHDLIQQLELVQYSVIGYSMGGRIALAYALQYPREIAKLIMESASYGEYGELSREKRRRDDAVLAEDIRQNGIEWFESYWSGLELFKTQARLPEKVRAKIRQRRLQNEPYALANTLLASGQGTFPCLKDRVAELTMPVLFVSGELDPKYQKISREFSHLNARIIRQTISGVGHNTHLEDPQTFRAVVSEFLSVDALDENTERRNKNSGKRI
ncbi:MULTISPECIES: 2-succinyl-6-hydroxy-2,4-cyclohexadiene-1-carboxylate synthase [Dehalobacter]|jgi:2-succinyl-6-hydroxy-2,4-cyclohexadiene-1-carboxylate synthase|uniref:Putative 2-succinyl-6-hydroxy-2,4-cyclohexadiene-1-carboxylate synthase n=1 Tax=Dehalobacter restrictus (strain DSM 9455 / PER-K23) TaxID=871738 RepID=A0ABN4BW47_DEHRP|nr:MULTISPECIES: 2-succinyl-6-hydroxy-2,4-cyclohexadiene-1-carboxylate synthase [Dehalobacter]AFV05097.1 2-succinyl-6-hydroxy-2,4-cyclohexadiene-1-carboxylate synthase [Dehalobacter sp. CF]AHF10317.1 2-succinyl-6-hydroxy-2,4-cyclohexadiene-1-carboxylate synthase [Dehalobacter restrictus DSM 9455]MDJ0306033.1 2-succinyl-6-hydroxy-2,4-cyclohexadiene-1-carboxylate synthase [Dehalobacter sp.]OCZ49487.1 2-succinyl-6-hydroxy-2,4-cyclohexadiene-1-carboxylate synthase [Dehalobacter sp. TeCB1]